MLYAVVSDVHANLPAWKSVLADLTSLGAERIISLGDVVGYGPEPAAVLESMHRHVDAFVMGNHDAALCGKLPPDRFNSFARAMIDWTAARVSRRGKSFLAGQSLALTGPGFSCVHGDLAVPGAFRYILDPEDALGSWEAAEDQLIFVGHSHLPGIFVRGPSGRPHLLPPQDFVLEEGKRFIVNVGSVGYPRDGDPRASYCLFETGEQAVRWRRVPFDIDALREAARRAGLDMKRMPLLDRDPLRLRKPVREQLQFNPAADASQMARDVVPTRDLATLRRRVRRWRVAAAAGIAAAALAAAAAATLAARLGPAETAVPAAPLPARVAVTPADLTGNLLPPLPASWDGVRLGEWRYVLSRPAVQRLGVETDGEPPAPRLRIVHARRARCRIEAPEWVLNGAAAGRKLQGELMARRGTDFNGTVVVVVDAEERDATGRPRERPALLHFPPAMPRKGGWEMARRTTDAPLGERTRRLRFRVEADFSGTLEIADPALRLAAGGTAR